MVAGPAHAGKFLWHRKHLSLAQKISYFRLSVRHERQAVAFLSSRHAPRTLERHTELRWHQASLRWAEFNLRHYQSKLAPPPVIGDLSAWLCIHSGEGSWTANTGNGYYGGLQMDYSF